MSVEGNALRPSFFEVYAVEQLTSSLRPALRFVLEVISVRNPRFVMLASKSDEIFALLSFLLETSHLRKYKGTVAESFYSLRRSSSFETSEQGEVLQMPWKKIPTVLMWTVLFPYVRVKLDNAFSERRGGAAADLLDNSRGFGELSMRGVSLGRRARLNRLRGYGQMREDNRGGLVKRVARVVMQRIANCIRLIRVYCNREFIENSWMNVYPAFTALADGAQLLFRMWYLFDNGKYFTPALAMQDVVLRRTSLQEQRILAMFTERQNLQPRRTWPCLIANYCDNLLTGLKYSFFISLLAFRFLEYYYAAEVGLPCSRTAVSELSLLYVEGF